uniref:Guanylate cyclase activator 2B n=1 Tax=Amphilophus citrinellus TaxID=61819 RepID=A0A3Q0S628_AMPCI
MCVAVAQWAGAHLATRGLLVRVHAVIVSLGKTLSPHCECGCVFGGGLSDCPGAAVATLVAYHHQAGDRRFPLEAVKQLKKIVALDDNVGRHLDTNTVRAVCANPLLPQVFRPVCQRDEAGAVFSNLLATDMNECEICANPACTGCMY